MDIGKLRFNFYLTYKCDEGEGSDGLDAGTYEDAVNMWSRLDSGTYITGYYHYIFVKCFEVLDENGNELDLSKILNGEYDWISEFDSTDKDEATEYPSVVLSFLEDLKTIKENA